MITQPLQSALLKEFFSVLFMIALMLLAIQIWLPDFLLPFVALLFVLCSAYLIARLNITVFFTLLILVLPFSTSQKFFNAELSLMIPSEPLSGIMLLAFIIRLLLGHTISPLLYKHPLFMILCAGIFFQLISTFQSSLPMVSVKSMLIKLCYITVFFVLAADLYLKQKLTHQHVLKTYFISILIVGIFIFIKHFNYGLSKDYCGTATEPFYADHTIYSACLAMLIPLPLFTLLMSKQPQIGLLKKWGVFLCLCIMLLFFFFTYSRAGWLSFMAAGCLTFLISRGLSFNWLMILMMSIAALFYMNSLEIAAQLKQNKADSNAKNADIGQQTKSVVNISNDQSNAERLNRWKCALRMFTERPFTGFGPGTYQFEYLSYQRKSEMTRISVTNPYNIKKGKGGTAHSEYLLILSESGLLSFLSFILLIIAVLYYAIKAYHIDNNRENKMMILIMLFGFSTYIIHGLFNNFLDTDKAALLFYTSIAGIMVAAIKSSEQPDALLNN